MAAVVGRSTRSLESNMRYAGFWPRLGAIFVDIIVMAPLMVVSFWTLSASRTTGLLIEILLASAFAFHNIYFIGRWGQTIGKMALKIRVVRLNGADARFRRAFYRHAVDLAFSVATSALTIYALMSVTDQEYSALIFDDRLELVEKMTGAWIAVLSWLSFAWVGSELVVLLLNEKRRALHDYIAGTVVVHTKEACAAV
jgi:uncharacterized RDD family membrane protein YckC